MDPIREPISDGKTDNLQFEELMEEKRGRR